MNTHTPRNDGDGMEALRDGARDDENRGADHGSHHDGDGIEDGKLSRKLGFAGHWPGSLARKRLCRIP